MVKKPKTKRYRIRQTIAHYADFDYFKKLTPAEKAWLLQFCDEYYHAAVRKDPKKGQIHTKAEHIKQLFNSNNARNRDLMNKYKIRVTDGPTAGTVSNYHIKTPKEIVFKDFTADLGASAKKPRSRGKTPSRPRKTARRRSSR
jgi:hypothetical protein